MDTKTVAVITVFAALTIALNLSPVKIPAPYAPYLIYQLWEIPIVAAFLLYGWRVGLLITIINTLILIIVFPGVLLTGPLYNLAAVMSMLLGVGIVGKSVYVGRLMPLALGGAAFLLFAYELLQFALMETLFFALVFVFSFLFILWLETGRSTRKPALFTMSGIAMRVVIMSLVNWTFLRFPPPFGFSMPNPAILLSLPLIAIFNATLALYTIPTGYVAARVVKLSVKPVQDLRASV